MGPAARSPYGRARVSARAIARAPRSVLPGRASDAPPTGGVGEGDSGCPPPPYRDEAMAAIPARAQDSSICPVGAPPTPIPARTPPPLLIGRPPASTTKP